MTDRDASATHIWLLGITQVLDPFFPLNASQGSSQHLRHLDEAKHTTTPSTQSNVFQTFDDPPQNIFWWVQEEIFEVGSEGMPIDELAEKLAVNQGEIIKTLFMKGIMVSVNQVSPLPLLPGADAASFGQSFPF